MTADIDSLTFEAELAAAGDEVSPARAGLLLARELAYPDMCPSDYLDRLDELAAMAHACVGARASGLERALALSGWLFKEQGFRGNTVDYDDPRNSYLNEVLDRRLGIPLSLSVVFLEIAQRLGVPAEGVAMPGHFIVSVAGEDQAVYLDPFHGGHPISLADCAELVRTSAGHKTFDPQWLAPTSRRDIVARMLNNLRHYSITMEDWPLAVKVAERIVALQPEVAAHLRDLGVLYYHTGAYRKATALFDEYLAREPNASDCNVVRQGRDRLLAELARLN